MILEVKDLVCGYHPGRPIIGPISFNVDRGEVVCLIGPNGIGKTTLFKTVLGILKPQSGSIMVCQSLIDNILRRNLRGRWPMCPKDISLHFHIQ